MQEQFQLAVDHVEASRFADAERICRKLLKRSPNEPNVLALLARAAHKRGNNRQAVQLARQAIAVRNDQPQFYIELARAEAALGAGQDALRAAERAVRLSPNHPGGYELLSSIMYPGEIYYAVLGHLHELLAPRTYVEIGVETGRSLALCGPDTVAVGIDPAPRVTHTLTAHAKLFELTSDAYFAANDLRSDLGNHPLDLCFLDGLHVFEQTLRDFINIERYAATHTVVAIHDVLPIDSITAARDRKTNFWTGDIWKMALCLAETRPDLELAVIPTPPSGLLVVGGLDACSTVLADRFEELVASYRPLMLDPTAERRCNLTRIANERGAIKTWLDGRRCHSRA